MTKYLCIQRSQPGQPGKGKAPSPAQMEEMYAKFNAWREKYQENIVDMGGKLNGAISPSGANSGHPARDRTGRHLRALLPIRSGQDFRVVGNDIVLIEIATNVILDVMKGMLR